MALLSGPGRFEESVSAALGLSILFIYLSHRRGGSFKPLELFEVAYFGALAVIGFLASDHLAREVVRRDVEPGIDRLHVRLASRGEPFHPSVRQGDDAKGVLGFPPTTRRRAKPHRFEA
jgi:hypothetical protein